MSASKETSVFFRNSPQKRRKPRDFPEVFGLITVTLRRFCLILRSLRATRWLQRRTSGRVEKPSGAETNAARRMDGTSDGMAEYEAQSDISGRKPWEIKWLHGSCYAHPEEVRLSHAFL